MLKLPPDIVLSQAYVALIKSLIVDQKERLTFEQIIKHPLFKNLDIYSFNDQVPPYIPKIISEDDTSNFSDIEPKRSEPNIENFKNKTQFSGRNLPFIGFTYTRDTTEDYSSSFIRTTKIKDEITQDLKLELQSLRRKMMQSDAIRTEKENLEKKLEENTKRIQNVENLRDKLERDLSKSISECLALKRTLELERKDRSEVERKALELIKSAKEKWENAEKTKIESLILELEQQREKVFELTTTNETLNEQLKHALHMENKQKVTTENIEKLSRKSVIGLESRLERITTETQNQLSDLKVCLFREKEEKTRLVKQYKNCEIELQGKFADNEVLSKQLKTAEIELKNAHRKIETLEKENRFIEIYKNEIDDLKSKLYAASNNKELAKQLELQKQEMDEAKSEKQVSNTFHCNYSF